MPHLFDQNIINRNLIYSCSAKQSSQPHYYSFQCHVTLQKSFFGGGGFTHYINVSMNGHKFAGMMVREPDFNNKKQRPT